MINKPTRKIGGTTVKRLMAHAARRRVSLLEAAREAGLVEGLGRAAILALARFVALVDRLSLLADRPVKEILDAVLADTGYRAMLQQNESEEDDERLANIEELITAARQFDESHPGAGGLEAFLEDASLVNDTDAWAEVDDRVTLMTLHASKGLEFPVVFIVAVEEGILPHERSRDNIEQLEEERRLLFVGMTRAREELSLSRAAYRDFRGLRRPTIPSMFLMELPRDEMELVGASWMQRAAGLGNDASGAEHDHVDPLHDEHDGLDGEHDLDREHGVAGGAGPTPSSALSDTGAGSGGDLADVGGSAPVDDDALSFDFGAASEQNASHASSGAKSKIGAGSASLGESEPLPLAGLRLTTAAQLAGDSELEKQPPPAPEVFCQDMLVVHPDYGLGRIVSLSGAGSRRQATVNFVAGASAKKFMLLKSTLRPAK